MPHHLALVMNFLGFAWPEIDEDGMRDAGTAFRSYARDLSVMVSTTDRKLTRDLADVCDAQAYAAMAQRWCEQTKSHVDTVVEGCDMMGRALQIAAEGVIAMKLAVIAQLEVALAEFLADQAAAVFTLGIAEAALPLLYAVQNRIINGIVQAFEVEVMNALVEEAMHPIQDRVKKAADAIRNPAPLPIPKAEPGLRVDTAGIRRFASDMGAEAAAAKVAGDRFATTVSHIRFTQG